ncbi:MAG: hypothetical protein AAB740_04930 [Patescibacteria group bacterium]
MAIEVKVSVEVQLNPARLCIIEDGVEEFVIATIPLSDGEAAVLKDRLEGSPVLQEIIIRVYEQGLEKGKIDNKKPILLRI